jgi:drug/metabolite transporter (DMT)-like permease
MRGFTYLILAGIFLGTIGIWVKLVGSAISPFLLAFLRVIFACLLIFALLLARKKLKALKLSRKDLLLMIPVGFFGVTLGIGLFVKSLTLIPVANAVLLLYIYPLVTALLAWIFLKEKISHWEIIALILISAGIWTIYGQELNLGINQFGNFLAILTGISYSVFIVSMRYFERKGYGFWDVIFWPLFIGSLLMVLFLFPFEPIAFSPSQNTILFLSGLVIVTFFSYVFYALGLKTVRAHNGPIIVLLTEPFAAILLAWLVLGEMIPQYVAFGGFLIILANLLVEKETRKKKLKRKINRL